LSKAPKKNSTFVSGLQRCEICETTLTLYPRDFTQCPHCHKRVCRQCWGEVWATKTFAADACGHLTENDGLAMSSVTSKGRAFQWDWQRIIFTLALGALAVGTLVFLFNLFIF
jgi:hypothetical protein